MRPFTWILVSFPVYLLVRGRLIAYLAAMTSRGIPTGANTDGGIGLRGVQDANPAISPYDEYLSLDELSTVMRK